MIPYLLATEADTEKFLGVELGTIYAVIGFFLLTVAGTLWAAESFKTLVLTVSEKQVSKNQEWAVKACLFAGCAAVIAATAVDSNAIRKALGIVMFIALSTAIAVAVRVTSENVVKQAVADALEEPQPLPDADAQRIRIESQIREYRLRIVAAFCFVTGAGFQAIAFTFGS